MTTKTEADYGSGPLGDGAPCEWCNKLACDGYCKEAVAAFNQQGVAPELPLTPQEIQDQERRTYKLMNLAQWRCAIEGKRSFVRSHQSWEWMALALLRDMEIEKNRM